MKTEKHWPWWMILLWAYSVIILILIPGLTLIGTFLPAAPGEAPVTTEDIILAWIVAGLLLPALIFNILTGIRALSGK